MAQTNGILFNTHAAIHRGILLCQPNLLQEIIKSPSFFPPVSPSESSHVLSSSECSRLGCCQFIVLSMKMGRRALQLLYVECLEVYTFLFTFHWQKFSHIPHLISKEAEKYGSPSLSQERHEKTCSRCLKPQVVLNFIYTIFFLIHT